MLDEFESQNIENLNYFQNNGKVTNIQSQKPFSHQPSMNSTLPGKNLKENSRQNPSNQSKTQKRPREVDFSSGEGPVAQKPKTDANQGPGTNEKISEVASNSPKTNKTTLGDKSEDIEVVCETEIIATSVNISKKSTGSAKKPRHLVSFSHARNFLFLCKQKIFREINLVSVDDFTKVFRNWPLLCRFLP